MDRHGCAGDVRRQVHRALEEQLLGRLVRPQLGHGGRGAEQGEGGTDSGDLHEQGFMVRAEVVAGRAILREAALQAQIVAVTSMGEDHHRAAQPRHVQQRASPVQQPRVTKPGPWRGRSRDGPGKELIEQFVFARHCWGIEPRHGFAGQVRDIRQRHEPADENGATAVRVVHHGADAVAFLQQITEQ